jgi:hypothetical protein
VKPIGAVERIKSMDSLISAIKVKQKRTRSVRGTLLYWEIPDEQSTESWVLYDKPEKQVWAIYNPSTRVASFKKPLPVRYKIVNLSMKKYKVF